MNKFSNFGSYFEEDVGNLSNLRMPDFYHLPDEVINEALNDLGDYATMKCYI